MTTSAPVPADVEADSIVDLVEDCREVSGMLAPYFPTEVRIPPARTEAPVEIDLTTASALSGYEDYGS